MLAIQHVTQTDLPQIMAALLVVSALGQLIARVGAGDIGVKVGGVVGQQTTTHQLFLFPYSQQTQLRLFQGIVSRGERLWSFGQVLFKGVPEGLRSKAFGGNMPERRQDGGAIPIGDFSLGARLADAVDGRQQEVVSGRGSGAWRRPERLQQIPDAGLLSGGPEGSGQAKLAGGGGQGDGGEAIADQLGEFLGGAEISLTNDAGLGVGAGTFDDVVVEFIAFLLGEEAWLTGKYNKTT